MDQEEPLDFQTLRAKFQNEELPLKPPKEKPVLPEKPKVAPPPPQSPTHHLPTGARSTFLATINDNLERKTLFAPRVVFKDDKESKKPLIHSNSKGKDKSVGKLKAGKDKTFKGSRENLLEDLVDQKKENGKDKMLPFVFPVAQKASTAELVPATPPPKATVPKKKVLLGFKKSKKDSLVISADPILDAPSLSVPGPAPLIPLPSEFGSASQEPEISAPESLLPENPTLSDYSAVAEIIPPSTAPESPDFNPPPPIIPDNFATEIPSPNSETPPGIESPALPVSIPDNQNEIIPSPPSVCPPPPPVCAITGPPAVVSAPSPSEPENTAESGNDIIYIAALEKPPAQAVNPPSNPPSPKAERPISALSALERAEDMSAGKKTSPGDQRIFNALQKARRKTTSPLTNPTPSYSVTPPPEEHSPPQSPTHGLPELPPIDYEDRIGSVLPPKPAQVNGINHRQPSPLLEEITERPDPVPELLEVPRPPPRKTISDVGPPEESVNNPSVNLSQFIPPPQLEDNAIPALHQFSETSTPDVPEVDNVASDVHFPDLPASEWEPEEHTAPDVPDGQNLQLFHNNGITVQETDAHTESSYEGINPLPKSSLPVSQGLPAAAEPQADDIYHNAENVYEYVSTSDGKSKVKTKTGKKQKGQPKNPYVETAQETLQTQEKSKTGRFGKSEKKAAAEGPDEKEMKKKEKQRLEKEKKELKEKQEREKKEQKEREKKENELKKKFKITGQEEAMYQATVVVTTKGRKNDLPVKTGDIVGIIRTTNCPKGKWLARDSSNNYGYVAVDHVELDIKEMIGMGKKTLKKSNNNLIESDASGTDSRVSNHYQLPSESFTDDSEEWTGDEEPASPEPDTANPLVPLFPLGHTRTFSMPDMGNKDLNINHQHSRSDMTTGNSQIQTQHEAIQKLTTFFQSSVKPAESTTEPEMSYAARPALVMEEANIPTEPKTSYAAGPALVNEEAFHMPEASSTQETDFSPDKIILPPPDMYADGLE